MEAVGDHVVMPIVLVLLLVLPTNLRFYVAMGSVDGGYGQIDLGWKSGGYCGICVGVFVVHFLGKR